MKKHSIARIFCNGLIFIALLLTQNSAFAQAESAKELDEKAWKKYESAYLEKTPAEQANAFEDAAAMFDEAAKAYRNEGNEARAKVMEANARAARSNAESRRKGHQHSDQSGSNTSPIQSPGFRVSLSGLLPIGNITPQQVQLTDLETAFHAPSIFEQLFDNLGGEFFIGDLSGQTAQNFEMSGSTQAMPGLRLGHRLGNRFELRAGGHYFQTRWSGYFPIIVFSTEQDPSLPPQTLQGSLSASSSGILAEADLAYFFTSGTIRPFVHAGIRGQFTTQNEGGATLAGVAIPLETTPLGNSYSPFGGAGIRVGFLKNGFVEANANYAKVPGGEYVPSVGLSLGWQFGMTRKPENLPELISINNSNCDCNGSNVSFNGAAKVTTSVRWKEPITNDHTFDTKQTDKSVFTHETRVAERDTIGLKLDKLDIKCQDCKVASCLPSNIKISVKITGGAKFQVPKKDRNGNVIKDRKSNVTVEEKSEVTLISESGYDFGVIKVGSGSDSVRLEITVKYTCGSATTASEDVCKKSDECKNEFVVIINRE